MQFIQFWPFAQWKEEDKKSENGFDQWESEINNYQFSQALFWSAILSILLKYFH